MALLATGAAVVAWWLTALDARLALWPDAALAALLTLGAALAGKLTGLATADLWLWWVGRRFRHG